MIGVVNLTKTFGSAKALDRVSLEINAGEMVALIGPPGSGKSTLMRHLAELAAVERHVKPRLGGGRRSFSPRLESAFQRLNLLGRLSVQTSALLGALGRTPLWRAVFLSFAPADRAVAARALEKVGLAALARERTSVLSGGQRQRLALAQALVQEALMLVSDDPLASLDIQSSHQLMSLMRALSQEEGLAVVISLNQMEYLRYCPRVVALSRGRVAYDGDGLALTSEKLAGIFETAPPLAPLEGQTFQFVAAKPGGGEPASSLKSA